jgi:hypothetical protein
MRKLLANPIVGFAPWIVMSVITGPGRFELAAAIALVLSIATIVAGLPLGMRPKLLDVVGVGFFGALLVAGALADKNGLEWLETWSGELSNIAIALVALLSIAARTPFTIQYARESTPREYWDAPLFLKINYTITWVWTAAFVVSAIAGWIGDGPLDDPNNLWTGWVIQVGAIIAAVKFTDWYPDHASAQAEIAAGERPPGERPAVADLLLPLAGYLPLVGVAVLAFTDTPWWIGVGLIVFGGWAAGQLRNVAKSGSSAGATRPEREAP